MSARLAIPASRNLAFRTPINLYYFGAPIPSLAASVAMQVRLYPGATGEPLLSLSDIAFTDSAAATTKEPDRRVISLSPVILEADLVAMPTGLNQPEPGEADRYSYDIIITYDDGIEEKLAWGDFILEPGVTK